MELLTLKKIELKNTVRKLLDPFEFDLEMHCKEDIDEGVIFSVIYTVNVSNENEDQVLSETEICPIPKGNVKFSLEADAPDLSRIPYEQLFGLTSIIIVGKFKDQQFMRVGYIVDVYYPGISNEKLLYNETEEDAEDIVDDDLEEEDEDNDNFDDLIVEDEEGDIENSNEEEIEGSEDEEIENIEEEENEEDKKVTDESKSEETPLEPKKFTEAIEENLNKGDLKNSDDVKNERVNETEMAEFSKELEQPVFEKAASGDVFEFRGFEINKKNIEMNVMVPPSVHSFLISWKEEAKTEGADLEEDQESIDERPKKIKTDE